jgi:ribosomal protein S18 acetylase RimI-like enzyme
VDVRPATENDLDSLRELYGAFVAEIPPPTHVHVDLEHELDEVRDYVHRHVALVADGNGDGVTGFLLGRMLGPTVARISDLYVVPGGRKAGTARALMQEATSRLREQGAEAIEIDVQPSNELARSIYERWGFEETLVRLAAPAEKLERRLAQDHAPPSRGLVFVQSDDEPKVEKAVHGFVPRLGRSARTEIHPPQNGWTAVDDELCSGDPQLLRRLAQELSYRTGGVVVALGVEEDAVVRYIIFERGSVADEYASVPEYRGPLPPGDVVALSANPTVAHRLTGADAGRVRAVARTAPSIRDLPPADELYRQLADALGLPLP